jgi:K+ transporter
MARAIQPICARLFAIISKNATGTSDFFCIPTIRVVEPGTQLVI